MSSEYETPESRVPRAAAAAARPAPPAGSRCRRGARVTKSATRYGKAEFLPRGGREGTALCLSGGGYRAALFHLGALRRLNELGILAQVDTLTSVSGGTSSPPSSQRTSSASRTRGPSPAGSSRAGRRTIAKPMRTSRGTTSGPELHFAAYHPFRWLDRNAAIRARSRHDTRKGLRRTPGRAARRPRFVICAWDMRSRGQWVFDYPGRDRLSCRGLLRAHGEMDARSGSGGFIVLSRAVPGDAGPRRSRAAARRKYAVARTVSGCVRSDGPFGRRRLRRPWDRAGLAPTTRWCSSPTPRPHCPWIRRCVRSGARFAMPSPCSAGGRGAQAVASCELHPRRHGRRVLERRQQALALRARPRPARLLRRLRRAVSLAGADRGSTCYSEGEIAVLERPRLPDRRDRGISRRDPSSRPRLRGLRSRVRTGWTGARGRARSRTASGRDSSPADYECRRYSPVSATSGPSGAAAPFPACVPARDLASALRRRRRRVGIRGGDRGVAPRPRRQAGVPARARPRDPARRVSGHGARGPRGDAGGPSPRPHRPAHGALRLPPERRHQRVRGLRARRHLAGQRERRAETRAARTRRPGLAGRRCARTARACKRVRARGRDAEAGPLPGRGGPQARGPRAVRGGPRRPLRAAADRRELRCEG